MKMCIVALALAVGISVSSAQVVIPLLCNLAGCQNGACALSPTAVPFCRCDQGYTLQTNPNFCEDLDECAEYPNICNVVSGLPTPTSRKYYCVNTVGSYACLHYNPTSTRPSSRNSFYNFLLANELL